MLMSKDVDILILFILLKIFDWNSIVFISVTNKRWSVKSLQYNELLLPSPEVQRRDVSLHFCTFPVYQGNNIFENKWWKHLQSSAIRCIHAWSPSKYFPTVSNWPRPCPSNWSLSWSQYLHHTEDYFPINKK